MKYIMCSRVFPKGHPKAGSPTFFVEQILNVILPRGVNGIVNRDDISPAILPYLNDFVLLDGEQRKHHTIRAGSRFKPGNMVSLRVWSDKPYRSKQIEFAQVEVKKTWDFKLRPVKVHDAREVRVYGFINEILVTDTMAKEIARNDGLTIEDFDSWFCPEGTRFILNLPFFTGQIICWDDNVEYGKPSLVTENENNG